MATDAEKLAEVILEAHKRVDIPIPEWEEIRKLAKKIQGDKND